VLRLVLVRDHMRPIARIARAARNELPKTPAVESLQALPRTGGAEKLLAGAYGMAKAAEPFAKVFTDAALPADFRDRLTDAADAFSASLKEGAGLRSQQTGATEGLRRSLAAARRQVQVMDPMAFAQVRNTADDRPQFSRNTLFHNRGNGTYAELAQFAGGVTAALELVPQRLFERRVGCRGDQRTVDGHGADSICVEARRQNDVRAKPGLWGRPLARRKPGLPAAKPTVSTLVPHFAPFGPWRRCKSSRYL